MISPLLKSKGFKKITLYGKVKDEICYALLVEIW